MSGDPIERLGPDAIARLSSPYLDHGVKEDRWEIAEIDIYEKGLRARVRMTSSYVSPTDPGGFHLTIFATLEFVTQIANIYLHRLAGLDAKCRETWMRECTIEARAAIRSRDPIDVEMEVKGMRRAGETLAARALCRVTDPAGGLFVVRLTGFLG